MKNRVQNKDERKLAALRILWNLSKMRKRKK